MAEAVANTYAKLEEAGKDIAMPSTKMPDDKLIGRYLDGLTNQAETLNPKFGSCMAVAKPFIVLPVQLAMCVAPFYFWFLRWCVAIYEILPKNLLQALFGVALCFFGGTYVASIAAIEAFRQMGWEKVYAEVTVVAGNLKSIAEANKADDAKDEDGDGVADVMQVPSGELAQRKVFMGLKAIKEPARMQAAVGSLWASYIAVLATLKLEFARTTAFALGIVELVKFPITRYLAPLVVTALLKAPDAVKLDAEAAKSWALTIVESTLTLVAVAFAWYMQMIISAFYSGLRGGRMFADAVLQMAMDHDVLKYVPFTPQPFNPDESYLDEILGYSVAVCEASRPGPNATPILPAMYQKPVPTRARRATRPSALVLTRVAPLSTGRVPPQFFGFSFQFFSGFQLPFPMNIIFLPLSLIEWFLRIQISMTADGVH